MSERIKKYSQKILIWIDGIFMRYPSIQIRLKWFFKKFPGLKLFLKKKLGRQDYFIDRKLIRKQHWGTPSTGFKKKLLMYPEDLLFSWKEILDNFPVIKDRTPYYTNKIFLILSLCDEDLVTQQNISFLRSILNQMGFVCETKRCLSSVDLDSLLQTSLLFPASTAPICFIDSSLFPEDKRDLLSFPCPVIALPTKRSSGDLLLTERIYSDSTNLEALVKRRIPAIAFSTDDIERLDMHGFSNVIALPLEVESFSDIVEILPDQLLKNTLQMDGPNIVFIGPLIETSRLCEIVEALHCLPDYMDDPVFLYLIGKSPDEEYSNQVRQVVDKFNLREFVRIVDSDDMKTVKTFLSVADLSLTLSEDPDCSKGVLYAMVCDTPAMVYRGSGALSFFRGKGAIIRQFNPDSVARMIATILTNPVYAGQIIRDQREILEQISVVSTVSRLSRLFQSINVELPEKNILKNSTISLFRNVRWRLEGPFDSSYSLALVNRETAQSLLASGQSVDLFSTEGRGDFCPDSSFLSRYYPDTLALWEASFQKSENRAYIVSRNVYPPRTSSLKGRIRIFHQFAWEETGIPLCWVREFNRSLNGMAVISHHVKKILLDQGVNVPVWVTGNGVDHWERTVADPADVLDAKSFRFLHVSSCLPRKGGDMMLEAYGNAFRRIDDVSLIIKTFPNERNDIPRYLEDLKSKDPEFPHVVLIMQDLSPQKLKALYEQCDVLVAPSRAEGFGLPIAEAMISGLPSITTAWGGQMEFCNRDNSWLIDFDFVWAESHPEFECFNSVWAEPKKDDLVKAFREARGTPKEDLVRRAEIGRRVLLERFTWDKVVVRLTKTANLLSEIPAFNKIPKVGMVTTWNTPCGIATHAEHLLANFPADVVILANWTNETVSEDEPNVTRCWEQDDANPMTELSEMIDLLNLDALIVQFQYGFYNFENLSSFIKEQRKKNRLLYFVLHSTTDWKDGSKKMSELAEAFSMCQRLIAHSIQDLNRLKNLGLIDNVALLPPGVNIKNIPPPIKSSIFKERFVIASYGFFMPHKGFIELLEAFNLLVQSGADLHLLMVTSEYPDPKSANSILAFRERMDVMGINDRILLEPSFLSDEESLSWLMQADLIVFPYQNATDSSSGAVRVGISSGKPVAVTPLPMFQDVTSVTLPLPGTLSEDMAIGIGDLIQKIRRNDEEIQKVQKMTAHWKVENSFAVSAEKIFNFVMYDIRENQESK